MRIMDKHVGETPLSALQRLRREEGIPDAVRLSYAGRLDPMASGTLLVLEGEECADQKRYQGLDKAYDVEILLGATSDTGDVLGIVTGHPADATSLEAVRAAAAGLVGPYEAPYPAYSSRTVEGKPLFQWTLEGRLDEIDVPLQHGTIRELAVEEVLTVTASELHERIASKLALAPVTTDPRKALGRNFRIDEVRAAWRAFFASDDRTSFQVARFTATVGSGTYMRTLADDVAKAAGSRGLALSIRRTRIFLDKG